MKCIRHLHINLRVNDLAASLTFYGDVLGLESIKRGEKVGNGAWYLLGDSEIHLTETDENQGRSSRHFAIEVEDLAEARKTLTDSGATIEKEESWRFWTRDPSGNRIEFVRKGGDPS